MLSSANYVRDEGVLNTGQVISGAMTQKELNDPNLRVYYHQVKGAKTHLEDGAEIVFQGGMFATANPDIKHFLDKIADKRGTMIYTVTADTILDEVASVAEGAAASAGNAQAVMQAPASAEIKQAVRLNQQSKSVSQLTGVGAQA